MCTQCFQSGSNRGVKERDRRGKQREQGHPRKQRQQGEQRQRELGQPHEQGQPGQQEQPREQGQPNKNNRTRIPREHVTTVIPGPDDHCSEPRWKT